MKKSSIIVVVGQNSSGKSELGVRLAKKHNGEIISADSRQVYKKLDVGSGKVRGWWKKRIFVYKNVPHHCIDIANPKKRFTAHDYQKCARKAILDVLSRGKTPIIVGGTGFYIDAALGRVELGNTPPNPSLRKKLAKKSASELFGMLKKLDPERAKTVEQKNPRRLIRAIEKAKGKTDEFPTDFAAFSAWSPPKAERKGQATSEPRAGAARMRSEIASVLPKIRWIGIRRPPEELKKRIHRRLLKRLPAIIREVKKLHSNGVSWKRMYELGLEYRYVSLYVRGKIEKQEMLEKLEREIYSYARRQMTWFKRNKKIKWFTPPSLSTPRG